MGYTPKDMANASMRDSATKKGKKHLLPGVMAKKEQTQPTDGSAWVCLSFTKKNGLR